MHTKIIKVKAGEKIIEAGSPSGFVYIPFGEGLKVFPLGGYDVTYVKAWVPTGNTGVIRGAIRNSTIVAEQDIELLIIPKQIYLKHWYAPYSLEEFAQIAEILNAS
jgi:CRP-like cAMP-binding protein